jgi:hypothetical protein
MNCKPGDLAYLSSDCIDEGVIVEVLGAGPKIDGYPAWHCHSRTAIECEKMEGGKNVGGKYFMTDILVEDRYLRPISGVPVNDEVRDEVPA